MVHFGSLFWYFVIWLLKRKIRFAPDHNQWSVCVSECFVRLRQWNNAKNGPWSRLGDRIHFCPGSGPVRYWEKTIEPLYISLRLYHHPPTFYWIWFSISSLYECAEAQVLNWLDTNFINFGFFDGAISGLSGPLTQNQQVQLQTITKWLFENRAKKQNRPWRARTVIEMSTPSCQNSVHNQKVHLCLPDNHIIGLSCL